MFQPDDEGKGQSQDPSSQQPSQSDKRSAQELFVDALSEKLINFPKVKTDYLSLRLNVGGLYWAIGAGEFQLKPLPGENDKEYGARHRAGGSDPSDLIRIGVYLPDDGEREEIAKNGYSQRACSLLQITPEEIHLLGLEEQRENIAHFLSLERSHVNGRQLEYTVTREELPNTAGIIAAFIKARSFSLQALNEPLSSDDALSLVLGGLTGSGIANLADQYEFFHGEVPDHLSIFQRPELADIQRIAVPLNPKNRATLYNDDMFTRALGAATKPALAVLLKGDPHSEDYRRASGVIGDSLQCYYQSHQARANRSQFDDLREETNREEQRQLKKQFGIKGYTAREFINFPETLSPSTFECSFEMPDRERLLKAQKQWHYKRGVKTHEYKEGSHEEVTWFYPEKEYPYGDIIDETLATSLERGYLILPLQWKDDPAWEPLMDLWGMMLYGSGDSGFPLVMPVNGYLLIGEADPTLGRLLRFSYEMDFARHDSEMKESFSSMKDQIEQAYAAIPQVERERLCEQLGEKEHAYLSSSSYGSLAVWENRTEPLNILLRHMREQGLRFPARYKDVKQD